MFIIMHELDFDNNQMWYFPFWVHMYNSIKDYT